MSEIAILILLITLTILFIEALIHFNVGKNIKINELKSLMKECKTEINIKKILENQTNVKITKDIGIYIPNFYEIGSIFITITLSYLIIYYIDKFIENSF